jgi:hypothetical protein
MLLLLLRHIEQRLTDGGVGYFFRKSAVEGTGELFLLNGVLQYFFAQSARGHAHLLVLYTIYKIVAQDGFVNVESPGSRTMQE